MDENVGPACRRPSRAMNLQRVSAGDLSRAPCLPIGHLCPVATVSSAWGLSGPETGGAERGFGGWAGVLQAWGSGGSAAPAPRGFLVAMAVAGGRTEVGNPGPPAWRITEPHADPREPAWLQARGAGRGCNHGSAPRADTSLAAPCPDVQQRTPPHPLPSPDTGLPAWGQATAGATSTVATSP